MYERGVTMNEIDFRTWLSRQGVNKKVASDMVSRIKRIERETSHYDIDVEYNKDECATLLSLFKNKGINEQMNSLETSLPIGKYQLSTYKYALKKYMVFRAETTLKK